MMRSLFSGVSGLKVHQTKMDVIANNIANVNTVGYKASRVTFSEVFYQRIQGASAANADTGRAGTNPMQIGLGASVASIDNLMTQGASQRTDNATDVMIQGNGFFIVSDNSGVYFTRAGNIGRDTQNNLHINGMQLMGWDSVYNANTGQYEIKSGPVQPLSLAGNKQYVPPVATSIIDMIGNLNASEDQKVARTMSFFDSVGNLYTVDVEFTYHPVLTEKDDPDNPGTMMYVDKNGNKVTDPHFPMSDYDNSYWTFEFLGDDQGNVYAYAEGQKDTRQLIGIDVGEHGGGDFNRSGIVRFNYKGELTGYSSYDPAWDVATVDNATVNKALTLDTPPRISMLCVPVSVLDPTSRFGTEPFSEVDINSGNGTTAATVKNTAGTIYFDFSDLTQFAGEHTNAKVLYVDGNEPGTLNDISIDQSGKITGRYSNGMTRLLGQIPIARFSNPAGLEKVGSSLYVTTPNSGQFDGVGENGDLMGGALEMSNVDLSQEFTDMITTQRGFQANSRIITTSDDMLQELVNLKR